MRPVAVGLDAEFRAFLLGGRLFLWTNYKAPNWRIFSVDPENPAQSIGKKIVPEGTAPIEDVDAAGGRLFVQYLENVQPRVKQFDPSGKPLGEFRAPGPGTVSGRLGAGRATRRSSFTVPTWNRARRIAIRFPAASARSGSVPRFLSSPKTTKRSRSGTRRRTARACRCSSCTEGARARRHTTRRCSTATAASTSA